MNLRAKVAARSNTTNERPNQKVTELPEDPKAFLHEYKESKRLKQESRSKEFLNRLASKDDSNLGISKSSLRRRKRKQKAELKPKMQDLLESLESTNDTQEEEPRDDRFANVNIVDNKTGKYIEKTPGINKNLPNPKNKKGSKKIEKVERELFSNVLKDTRFKASPFASLKESIANRLKADNI